MDSETVGTISGDSSESASDDNVTLGQLLGTSDNTRKDRSSTRRRNSETSDRIHRTAERIRNSRGTQDGEQDPQRTAPPTLNVEPTVKPKRERKKKEDALPIPEGLSVAACSVVCGAIYSGLSILLAGNTSLALSADEQSEHGEALAACLATAPGSKATLFVVNSAPWIRLGTCIASSVTVRVLMVKQYQEEKRKLLERERNKGQRTPGAENQRTVTDYDGSQVTEIVAPEPIQP